MVGKKSPLWRGGKTIQTHSGYVMKHCPGHPRVYKNAKYVREHVLVMEEHLGRYLTQGENVHHKNGVRSDNRLENLELWVVSQPAGQRATDLLDWAREILTTYEPVEGQLRGADPPT